MRINKLNITIAIVFIYAILSGLHATAQNETKQILFNKNKVTLKDNGKQDTVTVQDPVTGEVTLTINPGNAGLPVSINSVNVEAEKTPYLVSEIVQKHIVSELCKLKSWKSVHDGTFVIGLNDIVITSDGEVAYYNFYKADFFEGRLRRSLNMDMLQMERIVKESGRLCRQKFKAPYLLLNINMATMKFSVHNGVVTPN